MIKGHIISEKTLLALTKLFIFAALISPVVFHFGFFFPHAIIKASWFQIFTEMALAFFVILICFYPSYRPRSSLLTWALAIFAGTQLLVALTSQTPLFSFTGNFSRAWGAWHVAHYFILYIIIASLFRTITWWRLLTGFLLAVSLFPAIGTLYLLMAADQETYIQFVGNPIYTAIYLYFHIFLAFWFASKIKTSKSLQLICVLMGLFYALVIFMMGTRSIMLALFVIGIATAVFLIKKAPHKVKTITLIACAALAIFYLTIFAFRKHPAIRQYPFFNRITSFSLKDATLQSRFILWETGLKAFAEKPILGWGQENYLIAFEKYYDPTFLSAGVGENWADRTHNIFIEQLVNGGMVATLAYLLLFVVAFIELTKYHSPQLSVWERFGLRMALVGYIVHGFFFLDALNAFVPLMVILAYINNLKDRQKTIQAKQLKPALAYSVSLATAVLVFASIYFLTLRPLLGNYMLVKAYRNLTAHEDDAFNQQYGAAKSLYAGFNVSLQESLRSFLDQVFKFSNKNNIYIDFIPVLKDLEKLNEQHKDLRSIYYLGRYYLNAASFTEDENYKEMARGFSKSLHEEYPRKQFFSVLYAQALASLKRHDEAVALLRQQRDLAPDLGKISWYTGRVLAHAGRNNEAAFELQKALKDGYFPPTLQDVYFVGETLMNNSTDFEYAIYVFNKAARLYPTEVGLHERLMYIYSILKNQSNILREANIIIQMNPAKQEDIKKFLDKIFKPGARR